MRNYIALALTSLAACTNAPAKETAASTPSAVPTVPVPAIDVNEVDSLIQRVVAEKRLVGLSVGVMQDGKVVLAKGYGFRSLEPKLPVTPTTMFGIGSVTKQFTCSSALLLEQQGGAARELLRDRANAEHRRRAHRQLRFERSETVALGNDEFSVLHDAHG